MSIAFGLAMAHAGAGGDTADELDPALGFSPADAAAALSGLGDVGDVELHLSNRIWAEIAQALDPGDAPGFTYRRDWP